MRIPGRADMRIHTKPTAVELDIGDDSLVFERRPGCMLMLVLIHPDGSSSEMFLDKSAVADFIRTLTTIMEG